MTKQKKDEISLRNAHSHLKEMNKKLDQKVEKRTAEIQRLLKLKNDFIHQLGHDLKNPLGPLIHLIPILEKSDDDPRHEKIYNILNKNVTHIRNIVNRTVRLAQLNETSSSVELEELNLFKNIDEIVQRNKFLFEDNNIDVNINVDETIEVNADKLLLAELFDNEIDNSVKYSKDGGTISIDAEKQNGFVLISITDEGIGMTEKQLQHIFDEFYKADGSRHDFDSSGLGMPIAKKIVEKHGGTIWAESSGIDKGSTIHFTLPKK